MSDHTFERQEVKARKEHECRWCGESINKGEHYYKLSWVFDGEFNSDKWHKECLDKEDKWMKENDMWDEYVEPYQGVRGQERLRYE